MTLEAALEAGARPAQPGEFTRRAFENGRVDLAQAEAVMRLIGAQGEAAARQARRQMDGAVSRGVEKARGQLLNMLAEIAACTDFPDEIEEAPTAAKLLDEARMLSGALRAACDPRGARVLETGLNVVIAGRPNVGKSRSQRAARRGARNRYQRGGNDPRRGARRDGAGRRAREPDRYGRAAGGRQRGREDRRPAGEGSRRERGSGAGRARRVAEADGRGSRNAGGNGRREAVRLLDKRICPRRKDCRRRR